MSTNSIIPQFLINHNEAFLKIKEMTEHIPNDQELGETIREYLNNTKKFGFIYRGNDIDLTNPENQ